MVKQLRSSLVSTAIKQSREYSIYVLDAYLLHILGSARPADEI